MRILADENFPGDIVKTLRIEGYDVLWIRTDAPGISDKAILAFTQTEQRVIVTFDKDFGNLHFVLDYQRLVELSYFVYLLFHQHV